MLLVLVCNYDVKASGGPGKGHGLKILTKLFKSDTLKTAFQIWTQLFFQ